jgi:hypothetical protein
MATHGGPQALSQFKDLPAILYVALEQDEAPGLGARKESALLVREHEPGTSGNEGPYRHARKQHDKVRARSRQAP